MTAERPQRPAPSWLAAARSASRSPPPRVRWPLLVAGQVVGSVDPLVFNEVSLHRPLDGRLRLLKKEFRGAPACVLDAAWEDTTAALNVLADRLRNCGLCGPWRNEQLRVPGPNGEPVGTIERGAVRVLGLATQAVHLVGHTDDGHMWVQQRSFEKPNNPGQWDTLMGGMVSAADTLQQALARETWEEAGLHVAALHGVVHGGHVDFARPADEAGGAGYMVERIDWFQATVPDVLVPVNQDGEVERFELIPLDEVHSRLAQGAFTPEAALVLAGYFGW